MATSSKDIETLWQRYSEEGSKKGISVRDFFEKNGVPYHVFEKWYKRKYQHPEIVDCEGTGSPDIEEHYFQQRGQGGTSQAQLSGTSHFHFKTRRLMFNINGAVKFKYIHNYRDMRGGYEKLSGVVRELSGGAMEEGTAYVFTSRNQKLVKVVRHEHNECQLYIHKFDGNVSFIRLKFIDSKPVYELEWKYVVALLSCPAITKLDHLCED